KRKSVKLGEVEIAKDSYETPFEKDPFEIPLDTKIQLLTKISDILHAKEKIINSHVNVDAIHTEKRFVSTEGADIKQHTLETGAGYEVTALDGEEVQGRCFPNSFRGDWATRGCDFVEELKLI
ncbi:MAG: hypothetical protein ABIC40_02880, partial [bacterium]